MQRLGDDQKHDHVANSAISAKRSAASAKLARAGETIEARENAALTKKKTISKATPTTQNTPIALLL